MVPYKKNELLYDRSAIIVTAEEGVMTIDVIPALSHPGGPAADS